MRSSTTVLAQPQARAVLLARLTLVGIALYVVLDIVAQLLPPHYSPISQAESNLAVGPYGAVMTVNFLLRGALSFALLAALVAITTPGARSALGYVCFGVWSAGAIVLAFFPTDVVASQHTVHGTVHLVAAALAFLGVGVGAILISLAMSADPLLRSLRPRALTIAVLAAVVVVAVVLGIGARNDFGLVERIFIGLALLWMAVVAAHIQSLPRGG